jgi:hypothetical protein
MNASLLLTSYCLKVPVDIQWKTSVAPCLRKSSGHEVAKKISETEVLSAITGVVFTPRMTLYFVTHCLQIFTDLNERNKKPMTEQS